MCTPSGTAANGRLAGISNAKSTRLWTLLAARLAARTSADSVEVLGHADILKTMSSAVINMEFDALVLGRMERHVLTSFLI